MILSNGVRTYPHTDHHGSVVQLSKTNGKISEGQYTYDAYGTVSGAGSGFPFLYTGQRYDPDTGLYYYKARYYSAALGRFLQTDPVGYEPDLNLYAYVRSDPVDHLDPTGQCEPGKPSTCPHGASNVHQYGNFGAARNATGPSERGHANAEEQGASSLGSAPLPGAGAATATSNVLDAVIRSALTYADMVAEIAQNQTDYWRAGKSGEQMAANELVARGYTIIGAQVYIGTPMGIRIIDFLVVGGKLQPGRYGGVEVRVNSSRRSTSQVAKDTYISKFGGTVISRESPLSGTKIKYDDMNYQIYSSDRR
jgi:RHS repeat-associated protein